jgi:general secretion pathway protein K
MNARGQSSGFIMVAVLAVMALLAGLVGAVSLVVRSNIASTRIEIDQLTGDALLRAGLEIAAYKLVTLIERPDEVDGLLIRLDDGTVTVFATPGGGKADLNASSAALLAAVYKASGLKSLRPEVFAARVVDWRDADDEKIENGAESEAYQELPYGPANEPFRTVDELQ